MALTTLVPHNPDQVYTYVGSKYDPDVDSADCDRLLECLEPAAAGDISADCCCCVEFEAGAVKADWQGSQRFVVLRRGV